MAAPARGAAQAFFQTLYGNGPCVHTSDFISSSWLEWQERASRYTSFQWSMVSHSTRTRQPLNQASLSVSTATEQRELLQVFAIMKRALILIQL